MIKIFTTGDINEMEKKVNEFLSNPRIIFVDAKFGEVLYDDSCWITVMVIYNTT